jgi:hypothetical protein
METGINAITGALVAGAVAIAIAAAPIVSAAPSEQQCLEKHCLEVGAPTIRQGPANVQISTSPKDMPAVGMTLNGTGFRPRFCPPRHPDGVTGNGARP